MLEQLKRLKKEYEKAGLTHCVTEIENKIKRLENESKSKQQRLI